MKTRRFMVYSLIYLILITALVYVLDGGDYTLKLLGYELSLPVALWFALPVAVFALLALLHMIYHSISFYAYKRNIKKDTELYADFAKEIFLALPSNKEFKTEIFKTSSAITRILSPWGLYRDVGLDNDELSAVISAVKSAQNGEVVELKRFKLLKDNPLFIKNELNKIENLKDYYLEILKNGETNESLKQAAYKKLIAVGGFADIKKFSINERNSDDVMAVIERFVNDDLSVSADEIFEILDDDKISAAQYTKSAVMLKDKLKPESFKSIFERLRATHQDAEEAYLFVLYDLGLLDELREILANSETDEHIKIKTMLFLRDNSKIVPIWLFFK